MKIAITCVGIPLTAPLRDYTEEKLSHLTKIVPKRELLSVKVELLKTTSHHHKGEIFRAVGNVHIAGKLVRGEAEASDLYAAIDDLKDELTREITNFKSRKVASARKGGRAIKSMLRS